MAETPSVGFGEAIKLYFSNYANFSGRTRRSAYFKAIIFINIITSALSGIPELAAIWALVTLLPGISMVVRRLHDTGRSGWYYLFILIPLVGPIMLLVWICSDSKEDNRWGPNPKRPSGGYAPAPSPALPDNRSSYYAQTGSPTAAAPAYEPAAPAASNITLRVCTGAMAGNDYSCPPGTQAILGRAPSRCQIVLDASYNLVSGVHCRIDFYDRYVSVTDLNSTNGTFVNGTRLTPGQPMNAQNGATIYLANSSCAFQVYFN